MSKILTGLQSTGIPHLGNILGAILPAIKMANESPDESFFFIADLHSITQIKNGKELSDNTFNTAATWLAFGLNTDNTIFYRQSAISQVTELAWYLSCFFPYQRLTLAHSFKDKSDQIKNINTGLFTYPMLMAADILIYGAEEVPVGKDQIQHIEITRDVASRFNHYHGNIFTLPKAKVNHKTKYIIGTDGRKMSKSKNNTINIFLQEEKLRKQIMGIKTDSKSLNEPKNPDNCNVFKLFTLIGNKDQISSLREKYINGGTGYGEAKQSLYELILQKYGVERERFNYFMANPKKVEEALLIGESKARRIADNMLKTIREKLGY